MNTSIAKQVSSLTRRLNSHLNLPLIRNGYALVSSAFLTAGIGFLYWIIAARLYPADVVGLNSALISAMMLLGGIAQLNLTNAHIRFIPTAGASTQRWVAFTYLLGPVVAVAISLVFLAGLHTWVPSLSFLRSSPLMAGLFILATMGWCLFAMQDGVLTGLRRATWVPVENTVFSLVKIIFMFQLLAFLPALGIFGSWILGLAITIIPTTTWIFRKLIPAHQHLSAGKDALPARSEIVRYVAGDYIGVSAWLAAGTLLPIMVTQMAGPAANAHYYLAWQIGMLLFTVNANMGSSLVVEASMNPSELRTLTLHTLRQLALLVVPGALVILVGAPLFLQLFGPGYAQAGAGVLRLLAVSALPNALILVFVNVSRVQRKIFRAALALTSVSVLVLALSAMLLPRLGLLGVGYAWVGGQVLVAAVILLIWWRQGVGVMPPEAGSGASR